MRLHLFVAAAALSFTGCSFNALGIGAESSGAASTSLDETSTTSPTSTTAPTTSDTTGDPADCGNSIKDAGEECDNGELNNGLNGSICKGDCTKNICGDGYLASNEGCDDGNTVDDDECSNACKAAGCGDGVVKPPEECDSTPGCSDLCKNPFCGDGVVNGDEACDDGVDNGDNKACTVDCAVATCGDGKIQDGVEACDDGNQVDDDECSNTCTLATCGDSKPQPGEDCDDGNKDDTDACSSLCKDATCGDGFLWTGMEECDDGPDNSDTKACTTSCKDAKCGDGFVLENSSEACDDGNKVDTDGCLNTCVEAKCGDGKKQDGVEDCDDGNMVAGDGCTDCNLDCGNGKLDMDEECDDSNTMNGDTCSDVCTRTAYMVFVTSLKYNGKLDGLSGADAKCNALAKGKVPGIYKAWLSDENTGATARLFHSDKPYIRPDTMKIADDWNDLLSADDLIFPINRTEGNVAINGNACEVWTNTKAADGGSKDGVHCNNWTDQMNNMKGNAGIATSKGPTWTESCSIQCDTMGRLYCFEQPAP